MGIAISQIQAAELNLGEVVELALQRHPEVGLSQSRQAVADRQAERSQSLLAGDAAVQLRYKNDRLGSDNGLDEWGAGVEAPLWLPGQKASYRQLAEGLSAEAQAAQRLLAWRVAGEVREKAWSLRLAQTDRDQAREQLQLAEALEQEVERRRAAGELADADWVLARQETLSREDLLQAAEAKVKRAVQAWRTYTGLAKLPTSLQEQPAKDTAAGETHPRLQNAASHVERRRAERKRARIERRASPLLSLSANHERGSFAVDYDDSLELSLSLPLGSRTQAAPRLAEAEAELTSAEAALALARRELEHEQEQAQLAIQQTAAAIRLAEQRMTITTRGEHLAKRAFELGESDLVALLRARNLAADAALTLERRRIEHQRAIARYNQILGVIPQ
jgi:outer membrane protein TolC